MKTFNSPDYVIVGGGSAGCVLANRLSADPSVNVLLLEAGARDSNPLYRVPAGFFPLMMSGKGNWNYETTPQAGLGGRTAYFPRGKVLGGSSAINGMVVSRGNSGDYDRWAELGNAGWSFADCLPYFKEIENVPGGDPAYRGVGGPVDVTFVQQEQMNPFARAWMEAGQQAGLPFNPDMNAETPYGVAQMQGNYANARRQSASACYLAPVAKRANLTVKSKVLVTRVIVENGCACGVEYLYKGTRHTVYVNREVILSGGVVNSPQLLQLSGIGDPEDIERHGIQMVHELPGVGKNLKDHLAISVKQRSTRPYSLLATLKPLAMLKTVSEYLLFRSGDAVKGPLEAWAHLKTEPQLQYPDIQVYLVPLMYNDHGRDIIQEEGFMAVLNSCLPRSVGSVAIRSADPAQHPVIDPQYLSDPDDLRVMREGIRQVRHIFAQSAFDDCRGSEYAPGEAADTDDALDNYIRRNANSLYHPVGTCKMGNDTDAVVDQNLCVHGVEGLRVVDASIMPEIISGNTNFPTMMIAEKAADIIRQ
ncbi:MAG: choline dehydrogenase [Pseudomonadales bacterium]|nr:choline dehydrogenase [Pseudomonadales bacterium]